VPAPWRLASYARRVAHAFDAILRKIGINFCIEIPARVSDAIGVRGYVPVKGMAAGRRFTSTLVPRGKGCHRLFLNGEVRRAAGIEAGDRVAIVLAVDARSRELPVAQDLEDALREADVAETFASLTMARRNEIIRWIEDAKRDDTRAKRIAKAVEHTLGVSERLLR